MKQVINPAETETSATSTMKDDPLALHGGPKAKRTPFPPCKRHGELEKRHRAEVTDSDTLFYFLGTKVFEFQKRFAARYGCKHCIACSSGTASMAALEIVSAGVGAARWEALNVV